MPYRYCHHCGHPIESRPTIAEDLRDGQFSPCCGTKLPMDQNIAQWLIELSERFDSVLLANILVTPGINTITGTAAGTTTSTAVGESTTEAVGTSDSTAEATAIGESTAEAVGTADSVSSAVAVGEEA